MCALPISAGEITYEVRFDHPGLPSSTASYCAAIFAPSSAATGNLPPQCSVSFEKSASSSVLPAVTPITVAWRALNLSIACENRAASRLQPGDRKAGVEGKGVHVRVGIGGR